MFPGTDVACISRACPSVLPRCTAAMLDAGERVLVVCCHFAWMAVQDTLLQNHKTCGYFVCEGA